MSSSQVTVSREHFEEAFCQVRPSLASYLFRLTANRDEAEDLVQDAYVRTASRLETYAGRATLKTWIFTVATNLARDRFRVRQRWAEDIQDRCRTTTQAAPDRVAHMRALASEAPLKRYEFREHVSYCFTCIAKALPLEHQLTLMLKDVYGFKIAEICEILGLTEGKVKHALAGARKTMTEIFERRCALVSKQGACHQCSEMQGFVNPKQDAQQARMALEMVRRAQEGSAPPARLYRLRAALVENVDPLHAPGADLHAYLLSLMDEHA